MPLHDWTRVDAGLYHAFHYGWIAAISDALNNGVLPPGFFALPEQQIKGPIPDVLTLQLPAGKRKPDSELGGVAVATSPPRTRLIRRSEADIYAGRANRISVRHRHGEVVAVIEIVSPGNKAAASELRAFVTKAADLITQGVHLLVIDPFPPGRRDPDGLHAAIWDECGASEEEFPTTRQATLAAYDAGPERVAYVEYVNFGEPLPDMPIFLRPEVYVPVPLESTYGATWQNFPADLKGLLDPPPQGDASDSSGAQ